MTKIIIYISATKINNKKNEIYKPNLLLKSMAKKTRIITHKSKTKLLEKIFL